MRLQSFTGGTVRNRHPFGRQLRRFAVAELAWFVDAAGSGFQDGGCLMFAAALQAWSADRLSLAALRHPGRGGQAQHVVARMPSAGGDMFLDSDGVGTGHDLLAKMDAFEGRAGWMLGSYSPECERAIPFNPLHVARVQASLQAAFGPSSPVLQAAGEAVVRDACSVPPPDGQAPR